jgi:methylated-DNA-protein-cysteine methyltransferase-like protein
MSNPPGDVHLAHFRSLMPAPPEPTMPKPKSIAFARIRAEVIRLVALIPPGKFTTYGSIAIHMNVVARHVATVLSRLTEEESATLPWHRVVGAEARISPNMDAALARKQRARLRAEGMKIDRMGFIQDCDDHFHVVGPRRSIRWSQG